MKPEIEADLSFNTQPPEGGWVPISSIARSHNGFNTQPPEGGWNQGDSLGLDHSSFNTQPPEGGWRIYPS